MIPKSLILQKILFQKIQDQIGDQSLGCLLRQVLHIDSSAVYRKIRGERKLGLDELINIVWHFDISMDELVREVEEEWERRFGDG